MYDGLRSRLSRVFNGTGGQPRPSEPADAVPDWRTLLDADWPAWVEAVHAARNGEPVLIAGSVGAVPNLSAVESLLALALTVRGAQVHLLLCDKVLPGCQIAERRGFPSIEDFVERGPAHSCPSCYRAGLKAFGALGLKLHLYSELLTRRDWDDAAEVAASVRIEDAAAVVHEGVPVGNHAVAGALRFFARGDLAGEPHAGIVVRRYLEASVLAARATTALLARMPFRVTCLNHGIYVPQGPVAAVCRRERVRVVTWNPAYRTPCFIFSHDDSYHYTMASEATSEWEHLAWTDELDRVTIEYLRSRRQGTNDWIAWHRDANENQEVIARSVGLDTARPIVGLLTNVVWDAQLHYPANAFRSMQDWVFETIRYFAGRPHLQLLIRAHPAELTGSIPSRQRIADEIARAFPTLPPNVYLIPPESPLSTYAAMELCNAVLVYGTKTGVELTSMGIPVIVAGEAWIRNKGLTLDASTREEYLRLLEGLPVAQRYDPAQIERARKYAFHFFFRRMIPLEMLVPAVKRAYVNYQVDEHLRLSQLAPVASRGLDVICDGILHGTPFVFRAEHELPVREAERTSP